MRAGDRLNSCGCRRGASAGFPEGGGPPGPSGARMEGDEGPMRPRHGLAGSKWRNREIEEESARIAAAGRAGHGRAGRESRSARRAIQAHRRILVRLPGSKAIRRAT